jgi:UDP-N-acetylmuramate dehydrogenase
MLGKKLTTISIGGPLTLYKVVHSVPILRRALEEVQDNFFILGGGSNVIISDAGLETPVIALGREFDFIKPGRNYGEFTIGGATSLMRLVRMMSNDGFSGLEFAGGIPASFGGAVAMNAGAHGSDLACVITEVTIITPLGEEVTVLPEELRFAYRYAALPPRSIVVSASIRLTASNRQSCEELRSKYLAERKARQPLTLPSCGSVFKNPPGEKSAGALLEEVGMKGVTCGEAQVSPLHVNWIVNPKKRATALQVKELIEMCRNRVYEKFNLNLEEEVRFFED